MNITCELVLKECLPCNDDPIANISAEAPDVDVFIGFRDFSGRTPLGTVFGQLGCKAICFSTISQQDADDCARRQAQSCVWKTWKNPVKPPIPPGPNSPGGRGKSPNTPGGIPPNNPRSPIQTFPNTRQTCEQDCPDGTPFSETVAAGTIRALSQVLADEQAQSLACQRALTERICFNSASLPSKCLGEVYSAQLSASGGTPFATHDYDWLIASGSLPPGLELDSQTGAISGAAFSSGNFVFTVQVIDAVGQTQSKSFSICIMEIVTEATLPEATQGQPYAQPLIEEPASVSSETWTLVSGDLPPGITLAANGSLNGTPTDLGSSEFTVQVAATCEGSSVSCQKTFTLEVVSGVDCMGEAQSIEDTIWTQISPPAAGTIVIALGDGTFSGVDPVGPFVEAEGIICNPQADPYDFTVDVNWTVAGFVFGINTQAIVRLNGVDHPSPVFNANGAYVFNFAGQLASGINTVRIYCTGNGLFAGTLNGTCQIRPLNPP